MGLVGLVLLLIVAVPFISFMATLGIFSMLLQWGLFLAMAGYLLGIPYAIGFRLYKGRWPRYD